MVRFSLVVENCTFENFNAIYGGAINYKGYELTIRNSKFRNLNASLTGGAIIAQYNAKLNETDLKGSYLPTDDFVIDSCEFSNVSSGSNGGAIYLDLDSGS